MDEQLFATACACGVVAGIIAAYAAREDMPSRFLSAQEEESQVEEEEEDNERESGSRTGHPSLSIDIYQVEFLRALGFFWTDSPNSWHQSIHSLQKSSIVWTKFQYLYAT
uniref:Uncharacterized protein n=1 Tax=Amphimedon queenslandica TaxID=400682 RepID=A0A1X7TMT6_AMPQE